MGVLVHAASRTVGGPDAVRQRRKVCLQVEDWERLSRYIQLGELPAKACHLGEVINHDVRVVRMMDGVVLMIVLGLIIRVKLGDLRDNRALKDFSLIQLLDVGFGYPLLLIAGVKDSRAILRARIRALPIQFRGVMRDGEKDFEELAV